MDVEAAKRSGFDVHLTKPVVLSALIDALKCGSASAATVNTTEDERRERNLEPIMRGQRVV